MCIHFPFLLNYHAEVPTHNTITPFVRSIPKCLKDRNIRSLMRTLLHRTLRKSTMSTGGVLHYVFFYSLHTLITRNSTFLRNMRAFIPTLNATKLMMVDFLFTYNYGRVMIIRTALRIAQKRPDTPAMGFEQ